eukprot:TRINITY_DN7366_c0_g1_i1.p1 TRINITY_DN7366_c0_g1~~TRINITY_DN7366_c0_g1_i1.p1  ORF type:complete len:815 (-),score=143.95 TRINITY_DN7366_c0_g1_i1:342-2786(-)
MTALQSIPMELQDTSPERFSAVVELPPPALAVLSQQTLVEEQSVFEQTQLETPPRPHAQPLHERQKRMASLTRDLPEPDKTVPHAEYFPPKRRRQTADKHGDVPMSMPDASRAQLQTAMCSLSTLYEKCVGSVTSPSSSSSRGHEQMRALSCEEFCSPPEKQIKFQRTAQHQSQANPKRACANPASTLSTLKAPESLSLACNKQPSQLHTTAHEQSQPKPQLMTSQKETSLQKVESVVESQRAREQSDAQEHIGVEAQPARMQQTTSLESPEPLADKRLPQFHNSAHEQSQLALRKVVTQEADGFRLSGPFLGAQPSRAKTLVCEQLQEGSEPAKLQLGTSLKTPEFFSDKQLSQSPQTADEPIELESQKTLRQATCLRPQESSTQSRGLRAARERFQERIQPAKLLEKTSHRQLKSCARDHLSQARTSEQEAVTCCESAGLQDMWLRVQHSGPAAATADQHYMPKLSDDALQATREAGLAITRLLGDGNREVLNCSAALTLEEELMDLEDTVRQCSSSFCSTDEMVSAANHVWGRFGGIAGYASYLRDNVNMFGADIPLHGVPAWQRMVCELEVAMRLGTLGSEELRRFQAAEAQLAGIHAHGPSRWEDILTKLMFFVGFEPLRKLVRYAAARVMCLLRRQKVAVDDWIAKANSQLSQSCSPYVLRQVADLQSDPRRRWLVLDAFDRAATAMAATLDGCLLATLMAGCENPRLLLLPTTWPSLEMPAVCELETSASDRRVHARQRVKAEVSRRHGPAAQLHDSAAPSLHKLRLAVGVLASSLRIQALAFTETAYATLYSKHLEEAMIEMKCDA